MSYEDLCTAAEAKGLLLGIVLCKNSGGPYTELEVSSQEPKQIIDREKVGRRESTDRAALRLYKRLQTQGQL